MEGTRLFLLISVWISAHACLAAGEVKGSWEELMQKLVPGKIVTVTRMSSANVQGKLTQITADSITVQGVAAAQTLERGDVFRVRYANVRVNRALKGMLIGAGVSAVACVISELRYPVEKQSKIEAAVICPIFIGIPGGLIAGAAAPLGPPLYEAEKVVRPPGHP